ncbi:MAG: type I glyceraldehyde-3-phosphate dehydrogenase [Bacteroidota bacterium]
MTKTKVAINGFGRIGRITLRAMLNRENIEVVAINDIIAPEILAHLFKYDSVHGIYDGSVSTKDGYLYISSCCCSSQQAGSSNGHKVKILCERSPANLPWGELGVDIVIDSTGLFRDEKSAGEHIQAGAKKVIISAPPSGGNIKSVVIGVSEDTLTGDEKIISNASCTTNCAAPMVKILDENWGIESGYITTIHAYTGDQNLIDAPHKDLRRARAAANSIIPTSTGAAKAITKIFPHLEGKMGGSALRVPVINGSVTDITCSIKKDASVEEINNAFKQAAENNMKGILEYTEDPIVSVDIIGNSHSCIFDSQLTSVLGRMVKVIGWYDNEMGYSMRISELVGKIA